MPVATVFENLEAGLTAEEVMEEFAVIREQIHAVLHFAARSRMTPYPPLLIAQASLIGAINMGPDFKTRGS